jgi:hypothetical protein
MVRGQYHTHIVFLGLEPENNEMVHCFTNLSAGDKFYLIKIGQSDYSFQGGGSQAVRRPRQYQNPVPHAGYGERFHAVQRFMSSCSLRHQRHGSYENVVFKSKITAFESLHKLDRYAVELWCNRKISEASGSVFSKRELDWQESGRRSSSKLRNSTSQHRFNQQYLQHPPIRRPARLKGRAAARKLTCKLIFKHLLISLRIWAIITIPRITLTTGNSLIFDRYANSVMRSCLSKLIGVEVRGIRDRG